MASIMDDPFLLIAIVLTVGTLSTLFLIFLLVMCLKWYQNCNPAPDPFANRRPVSEYGEGAETIEMRGVSIERDRCSSPGQRSAIVADCTLHVPLKNSDRMDEEYSTNNSHYSDSSLEKGP